MNNASKLLVRRFSVQQLITAVVSIGILLLAIASTIVISNQSGRAVRERLTDEGLRLADALADQSTLHLLTADENGARQTAETFLAFPDVVGIKLADTRGWHVEVSKTAGTVYMQELKPDLEPRPEVASLVRETSEFWEFSTPIYFGDESEDPFGGSMESKRELIGFASLLMAKQTLGRMQREIFISNAIVSTGFAALLLLVLLFLMGKITVPLQNLAQTMREAELGRTDARAKLEGTRDIVEMESAFNTMMNVLNTREQALKTARDQALESARAKSDFAATVSHELRTPLNGVIGMLELISGMHLGSKQSEYVQTARNSADMLLSLIDDILTFSRNDAGKTTLDVREFSVREGVEEILMLVAPQAQTKGLEIAAIIDENVPERLLGDLDRLRQVLVNLLGNAVKFTNQGEVCISVSLTENHADTVVIQFAVTDTGIGIDPDAQKRIFDAFSQADGSTTRQYGGTGLGLAISRQLTQLMGGDIEVDSTPKAGSTFNLSLPLLKPRRGAAPLRSVLPLPRMASLLLCDDSPMVGRSVACMLTGEQVRLDLANDCESASRLLRKATENERPYDVILLDESLKNRHGEDDCEGIIHTVEQQSGRLVLLCSGSRRETRSRQHIQTLEKPLRKGALMDCLKLLLTDSARMVHELRPLPQYSGEDFGGARVLVVEDNPANQDVALGMLERLACHPTVAADGIECIELLRDTQFDLILMDCQMPRMDGFEATRRIREMTNGTEQTPIIAMTANVQRGAVEACETAGMNDYLAKPVKLSVLKAMLGRWLMSAKTVGKEAVSNSRSSDSNSVIDREFLENLTEQLGLKAANELLQSCIEEVPVMLQRLNAAAQEGRLAAVSDTAGRIKKLAMDVGARRFADTLQHLETAASAQHRGPVDALLADVKYEAGLLQRVLNARLARSDEEAGSSQGIETSPGARILICDDDKGSRFALREVLIADGHEIIEADNGQTALERCRESLPDLILMDVRMPVMDGLTACRLIRELPGSEVLQVLMITGLNEEESIDDAFAAGANDYISKPVNYAVLRKRVDQLLASSKSARHMHELAYLDTLTGLPNRAQFNEHVRRLLSSTTREDSPFALLLLDLDRFKLVNDTMGHEAGDLLLKYFAERIQGCIRKGDLVARFGGDEFCVILDRVKSYDIIESITEKIHQHLSRPFVFMKKEMYLTTSIGIAVYPEHGKDISTLLRNADMAMYRAKESESFHQFYQRDFESEMVRRIEMESALRNAIERDELLVYYQPQIDLKTGETAGFEGLIRWNHPVQGLVSPGEFIHLAEETGLIIDIGRWVLCHVCDQISSWLASGFDMPRVAINLSARQLNAEGLVETVASVIEEAGVPATALEFEITESTIMEEPERVIDTLHQLKAMGIMLAIDDFGTGYSSLNYLKRFPIDYIKIDKAFIADVVDNRIDADIVRAIIAMARALEVEVIAEGVETEEQQEFLRELDCDIAQGYLISKPVPSGALSREFLKPSDTANLVAFPRT